MIDKIYILNLIKNTERKEKMVSLLNENNISNYIFFTEIDSEEENLDETNDFQIEKGWKHPFTHTNIRKGEISNSLSHEWIWEEIVLNDYSQTIVLRDDILFTEHFSLEKINKLNFPPEIDILLLNENEEKMEVNGYAKETKKISEILGYMITLNGAKKLLTYYFSQNIIPLKYFFQKIEKGIFALNNPWIEKNKQWKSFDTLCYPLIETDLFVLSIATHKNDGYERFVLSCNSYGYPFKILGLDKDWNGNIGNKLFWLFEELSFWTIEKLEKTLILFSDCYDVVFTSPPEIVIKKYKNFQTNKVLFQAEKGCWPIQELDEFYPPVDHEYRFLNSGGFIGYGDKIFELLNYNIHQVIPEKFQSLVMNRHHYKLNKWELDDQLFYGLLFLNTNKIILDYRCEIFQSLFSCIQDVSLNENYTFTNKIFQTKPCLLHGNGGSLIKIHLNQLSNYLVGGYNWENKNVFARLENYPKIGIVGNISNFNYPPEKIIFFDKENFQHSFLETDADFLFYCSDEIKIQNKDILSILIQYDKNFIAPLIVKNDKYSSNFWGDSDEKCDFKQSWDYLDIVSHKKKGIFNVVYTTDCFLIKRKVLEEITDLFVMLENSINNFSFCLKLITKGIFIYLTNIDHFGIYKEENVLSENVLKEWNNLENNVYEFPLLTESFCTKIISSYKEKLFLEKKNEEKEWEDILPYGMELKELCLDNFWNEIIEETIIPLVMSKFSFFFQGEIKSYVYRLGLDKQAGICPHHDPSTFSIHICLNENFEGGNFRFVLNNQSISHKKIGYALLHPGKLTNLYEIEGVYEGEKYIFSSYFK